MAAPRIQAIAILSPRNGPIYVRQFSKTLTTSTSEATAADLRYHYFAHAGIDVIEERSGITAPASAGNKNAEQYFGLLYTLEDLAVYGFQTSARLKFMIMLTLTDQLIRDIDVLTLFRAVHTAYLRYASNPFLTLPTNPASWISNVSTTSSSETTSSPHESVPSILSGVQDFNLPINCRQIRSKAFDRMIENIVGIQVAPPQVTTTAGTQPVTSTALATNQANQPISNVV